MGPIPFVRDFDAHCKDRGISGDLQQNLTQFKDTGMNMFITSGGMLQGPALPLFLELKDDPHNAIFLVGYQSPGTSGHAILEAERDPVIKSRLLTG